MDGKSVSKGISLNMDFMLQNGLSLLAGATFMDVSVTEKQIETKQLLTERFSGVWSITYQVKSLGLTIDYTGNVYGPMRLPLLGPLDPRDEYSQCFSIQNLQVTKKIQNTMELYLGVKNLLNFTPPSNSIARAFDPFDKEVQFDNEGQVIPSINNPNGLTFDPSYVFTSNQGIRLFLGLNFVIY